MNSYKIACNHEKWIETGRRKFRRKQGNVRALAEGGGNHPNSGQKAPSTAAPNLPDHLSLQFDHLAS